MVLGLQCEVGCSVLQRETAALRNDACAKTSVVAVDKRDAVAFAVCHAEVDGVGMVVGGRAVVQHLARLVRAEEFCSLSKIFGADELFGRHLRDLGIGYPPVSICKRDTQRLDDGMHVCRGIVVFRSEFRDLATGLQLLDDSQCHQRHDSLSIGGMFPQLYAFGTLVMHMLAVGLGHILGLELQTDGLCLLGADIRVILQVFQCQVPAQILHHLYDLFCNAALVEACFLLLAHRPERFRQRGVLHDLARSRSSAAIWCRWVLLEHFSEVGRCLSNPFLGALPLYIAVSHDRPHSPALESVAPHPRRHELADGETLRTQLCSGLQNLFQTDSATPQILHRVHPARRRARYADGMHTRHGDLSNFSILDAQALPHPRQRLVLARSPRAIQRVHLFRLRIVEEAEHVTSDARTAWLRHVQACGDRHGSIGSIAALL